MVRMLLVMVIITFRHGEDVDKDVSKSDVNSDGFITLISGSEFDKQNFESGSFCANFLFAFLSDPSPVIGNACQ